MIQMTGTIMRMRMGERLLESSDTPAGSGALGPAPSSRRCRAAGLLLATIATLAVMSIVPALAASEPIIQLSEDRFTNPTSQHRTEVEPDTFAFGSTWVSAFQAGRFVDLGASSIGFATSSDRGRSFVSGFLPGATALSDPAGSYDRAGDPSVAFDRRHHTWLISYLAYHIAPTGGVPVVDVLVSRSRDAVHWDPPVPVATLNARLDKNWTVCDNSPPSQFFGNCYTEFTILSDPLSPLLVSTSTDGGLSWGESVPVGNGSAGQPLVQPGGRVVMPFGGFCAGRIQICSVSSDDGGANWDAPVVISTRTSRSTTGLMRTPPLPSAELDREGRIYVVWKDCRFEIGCTANDLVLSTSDDGISWSDVRRIPLDPVGSNVDHFLGGIGVDPVSAGSDARLALTYYFWPVANCTSATCELYVGFVSSTDGGQTWSAREVLAGPMRLSWLAQSATGPMVADYISTSVLNGGALALPAFAVAFPPDADGTLNEAIFTARMEVR